MAAPIYSLPTELLELIVAGLDDDPRSLTRLLQCSKRLRQFIEPKVYGNSGYRVQAMYHACGNGNASAIRRAVSYGAPTWYGLEMALNHGHMDACKVLLELGAALNDGKRRKNRYHSVLLRRLCLSKLNDHGFLRQFFTSGLAGLLHIPLAADRCLVPAILSGASPQTVDFLLQYGADPNRPTTTKRFTHHCPLSAAAMVGSSSIFYQLLDKGADIHAQCHIKAALRPYRVPILAAAYHMAKTGCTEIFDHCLRLGVPINTAITNINDTLWREKTYLYAEGWDMTVLTVYLSNITMWNSLQGPRPSETVKIILNQHVSINEAPDGATIHNPLHQNDPYIVREALEYLLSNRGLDSLAIDEYYAVVELLAQHSPQSSTALRSLLSMNRCTQKNRVKESVNIQTRWETILNLLLQRQDQSTKDQLLHRHITSAEVFVSLELFSLTLDCFIASGANLNSINRDEDGHEYTVLQRLCVMCHDWFCYKFPLPRAIFEYQLEEQRKVFALLVKVGADPMMQLGGKSAVELLTTPTYVAKEHWMLHTRNLAEALGCAGV